MYELTSQDLWLLTLAVPLSCFMTLNLSFLFCEASSFPLKGKSWSSDVGTGSHTHLSISLCPLARKVGVAGGLLSQRHERTPSQPETEFGSF